MAVKKPAADPAHEETEKLIKQMDKRISKEYAQAEKEVQAKIDDYFDRFRLKDEKWREWVADGKKTAAEYKKWRVGQMAVGKRWESLKQTVAEDFAHTDQIARSIVNGYMPEVYAINFNYGTYEVEVGAKVDTSFTLYDRQTVERIMRDNPDLLPAPGKKVSKEIADGKAVRWNKQLIQSVMTQGILQGESIPKLATRLAKEVGDSDRKAAIRNARTMATGAQNAGRVDSYKRAEDMGIEMEQEWRATLDMRTRHEHRQLDGQRQKVGEPFTVDGYEILFPGDPSAEGFLIYNCRCTLRGVVAGLEPQARKYRDESALEGLTYDEWKAQKKSESNPITLPEEKGKAIAESYRREYAGGGSGKATANKTVFEKKENTLTKLADEDEIKYVNCYYNKKNLSEAEIIEKVCGGDKTNGSCSSVAFAYVGNKNQLDVTDFRGGDSRAFFASRYNIRAISRLEGVKGFSIDEKNDFVAAHTLQEKMEIGKEYILSVGGHTSVVKMLENDTFEYLELQSPKKEENGWHILTDDVLKTRFGCRTSYKVRGKSVPMISTLIDVESTNNDDFNSLLGYLNTATNKQEKGASGNVK